MNRLVTVVGVAAVATLAGCKDPGYNYSTARSTQNDVKTVEAEPAAPAEAKPIVASEKHCTCAPGTKHTSPCTCGANDCLCVVEVKPVAAAPETTVYIVQNGDYLAKISKKFNVTIAAIKSLNNLKSDSVRVGQKLKLPGKIDVGVQADPAKKPAAKASAKPAKAAAKGPYTGPTKEYVVKAGDTLGAIAYSNGCNIRQLKTLNGLKKDALRIGQKLKVPAAGEAKKDAKEPAAVKVAEPTAKETAPAAVAPKAVVEPEAKPASAEPAPEAVSAEPVSEPAPAAAPTTTYVVQEGDDITGVCLRWGVSAAAIRELNNLADDAQLKPGQVLKLPADAQQ